MNDREVTRLLREIIIRLDNIERKETEVHARVMTGGDAPMQPGDPAFRIAAREMLNGNNAPLKALGGRKMGEA